MPTRESDTGRDASTIVEYASSEHELSFVAMSAGDRHPIRVADGRIFG
jgi:hypothetical protein